jgi:Uma2 family endonuclease
MAATAIAPPPAEPAPFRFTRDVYHRLGEMGVFEGIRVELLEGEIVRMSPQSVPHASGITRFTRVLVRMLGDLFTVRVQVPLVLGEDSEPDPDFVVCDYDPDDYARAHPTLAQVHLVVEVAFTSVAYDRGRKGAAYARAGIPCYWLANLPGRAIEEHSDPDPAAGVYRQMAKRVPGDKLELPGGATADVADLLPPSDPPPPKA